MRRSDIGTSAVLTVLMAVGCNSSKPFFAIGPAQSPPVQSSAAAPAQAMPSGNDPDAATSAMGDVHLKGVLASPKPFVAVPAPLQGTPAQPTPLLLAHAVADSPVPLSEYAKQPARCLTEFDLRPTLSSAALQKKMGPPAQLADNSDPWLVYRLVLNQELWLHFKGPLMDQLDAADVVRNAEDGYARERVFGN